MIESDKNGDGLIRQNELLGFIQEYASRSGCGSVDSVSFDQQTAFFAIACLCLEDEGGTCCVGANAAIRTAGANDPGRTLEQIAYLVQACDLIEQVLPDAECSPTRSPDKGPPPKKTPRSDDNKDSVKLFNALFDQDRGNLNRKLERLRGQN